MASNEVNINLVRSIVEQVVRDDGTPEEQATKVIFLIREMRKKVLSMEETAASVGKYDLVPAGMRGGLQQYEESELSRFQEENAALKAEMAKLKLRLQKANIRYETLRAEMSGATVMSTSAETYAFAEFKRMMLEKHFFGRNKEQGWQQLFVDCNRKGFTQTHLSKWKSTDEVPFEAIVEIDKLDLAKKVGQKMERWTEEEKNVFSEYVVETTNGRLKLSKSYTQIARELSIRFGRNLNDNSIKSRMNAYKESKERRPK